MGLTLTQLSCGMFHKFPFHSYPQGQPHKEPCAGVLTQEGWELIERASDASSSALDQFK